MTDQPPEVKGTDPDGKTILTGGATKAAQQASIAETRAGWLARTQRDQFVDAVHQLTSLARDKNWDWLDAFCDGTVAMIPFVREQSPNAGAQWGALTAAQKAEPLRLGVSLALAEQIRICSAIDLIIDAIDELIAHTDVAAPPDR